MRSLIALSLATLGLTLAGCQGARTPVLVPEPAGTALPEATPWAPRETLAGLYEVRIDPLTLRAEVAQMRGGASSPPQGMQYDLDISNFLDQRGFVVTDVRIDNAGDFVLEFTHSHPFPAPDLDQPVSATNRADLGYTGRLLVLSSSAPREFFGGDVLLDPTIVKVADGFVNPGDLLATDEIRLADAYPYVLLADEAEDNRIGVTNGSDFEPPETFIAGTGNYDPEIGGWQRDNLGSTGDGWTGYDYLHAGQTIQNTLRLYTSGLQTQDFVLTVAVLVQYTDPRGTASRTHRMPFDPADPLAFAYRLPYAALDISKISTTANPMVLATYPPANYTSATYQVRDWDRAAAVGLDSLVGDQPDVSLVPPGTSGFPSARIDAPQILDVPLDIPPHFSSGDGTPGGEILFFVAPRNDSATAPAGSYWACLEVTDADASAPNTHLFRFGVDPETLLPESARALPHRTYQVQPVLLTDQFPLILATEPAGIVGVAGETVTFSAEASEYSPEMFWDFGDGATPQLAEATEPTVTLGPPGTYTLTVQGRNGYGYGPVETFTYIVALGIPEVTAVIPSGSVGSPNDQVQFSAQCTNEPTSWAWDFGGGASPNVSFARDPLVALNSPGTYTGTVTASNIAGDSEAFEFEITVGP